MEQTLVLIKPDALDKADEIIKIFESNDLMVEEIKEMYLDEKLVMEHYAHLVEFPFFPKLKAFMTSNYVIAMILSGENAVKKVRGIIGATNPEKAAEGTIRKLYGSDSTKNAVHASDSVENAQIEIERFFKRKKSLVKTLNETPKNN